MKRAVFTAIGAALCGLLFTRCDLDGARNTYCQNHLGVCTSDDGGVGPGTGGGTMGTGGNAMGGGGGQGQGGGAVGGGNGGGDAGTDAGTGGGANDCPPLVGTGGPMTQSRAFHAAVAVGCGRVLIYGGLNPLDGLQGVPFDTTEIYDSTTDRFYPGNPAPTARINASLVMMGDGRVLLAGGTTAGGGMSTQTYWFEKNGTWTNGPSFMHARGVGARAIRVDDGIVILGGQPAGTAPFSEWLTGSGWSALDPNNNTVLVGAAPATLGSRIFLFGGNLDSAGFGNPTETVQALTVSSSAMWNTLPSAVFDKPRTESTATLIGDARVIITGGNDGTQSAAGTSSVYLFDIKSENLTQVGTLPPLYLTNRYHASVVWSMNQMMMTGGTSGISINPTPFTALIDAPTSAIATVTLGPTMQVARAGHTLTMLSNGGVLAVGGVFNATENRLAERLPTPTDTWVAVPP